MSLTVGGFSEWLQHVSSGYDDFNCYHPFNMQTRYLSCATRKGRTEESKGPPPEHHLFQANVNLTRAFTNLQRIGFVGIADFYTQSVCAFEVFVSGRTKCWCENDGVFNSTLRTSDLQYHFEHGVPGHSVGDLTAQHLSLIDKLTRLDQGVYAVALYRFWMFVDAASNQTGVNLRCGATRWAPDGPMGYERRWRRKFGLWE